MKHIVEFVDKTPLDFWNSNFLTAILAFLGVALSVYLSNRNNKKMADRNEHFQKRLMDIQAKDQKINEEKRQAFEEKIANKQIDADIKAKSRIKWLNTTREISAEIISSANQVASTVNTIISNYALLEKIENHDITPTYENEAQAIEKLEKANKSAAERANEARYIVVGKTALFRMYFGPNEENDRLLDKSEKVLTLCNEIFDFYTNYTDGKTGKKAVELETDFENKLNGGESILNDFSDSCRSYYQNEWHRAKNGE